MKSMKKLIVAVLAVVAAMALCVPALAFAADDASITIKPHGTDTQADTTEYAYYEIFIADIGSLTDPDQGTGELPDGATPGKVAYYIPKTEAGTALKEAIEAKSSTLFSFTSSADGSRWIVELADDEAKADDIVAVLGDATVTSKALATGTFEMDMDEGEAKAIVPEPGYYIVTSTLGTKVAVQTLGDVTINEKNEYIVDEKVVETASVTIGESATYYIKVYLPTTIDTNELVTVHDEMADVLSFNDDLQVYVSDTDPGTTAAEYKELTYGALGSEYSVTTTGLTDNCDFHIDITTKDTDLAGKYVVFKFSAELLATADPDGDGYVNKEWSTYPGYKTVPSEPRVKTHEFDVLKTDGTDKLDGAIFELRKSADGDPLQFFAITDGYKKADTSDSTTVDNTKVTDLVINSFTLDGATHIQGLGEGTYYLVETKAADGGYNLLAKPIVITITENDDGTNTITATLDGQDVGNGSSGHITITVINEAGTQLPSTGGMGTTILYVVGGIMIALAAAFLIRRRMTSKKNESEDLM